MVKTDKYDSINKGTVCMRKQSKDNVYNKWMNIFDSCASILQLEQHESPAQIYVRDNQTKQNKVGQWYN